MPERAPFRQTCEVVELTIFLTAVLKTLSKSEKISVVLINAIVRDWHSHESLPDVSLSATTQESLEQVSFRIIIRVNAVDLLKEFVIVNGDPEHSLEPMNLISR